MKNKFILVVAALSFAFAGPVLGAESAVNTDSRDGADLKTVVSTIEGGYRQLKDLQAEFSQKTTIAAFKRDEKGSGELLMKGLSGTAAMFRFDYKKPKQQIVSDGRQVWFYIPENRQVMVSDVKTMLAQGGVALNYLTGLGSVSRDFTISFTGKGRDSKGNYLLELVPKKGGQAFAKLQLTISASSVEKFRKNGEAEDPFPIVSSVVFDQTGNRTAIDYSKVKVNQGLPSGKFSFKVPAGVEVLKQ
jgi:outer membrane lipoprotein carrier protein